MSAVRDIARAKAAFDLIRMPYGPQEGAVDALEEVLFSYVDREEGAPCGGAMMIAPFGTGKTETIKSLTRRMVESGAFPTATHPVLHVIVPSAGTVESIPTGILKALGKPRPELGGPDLRWSKALRGIADAGVQLLVFDEFNRAGRRETMSAAIAWALIETIMDPGLAPVAVVGSDDAKKVLKAAPDFAQRLDDRIPLALLKWHDDYDRLIFEKLLADLAAAMAERGLPGASQMARCHAKPLADACIGSIRLLMKIARASLGLCMERGGSEIDAADLEEATDRLSVAAGFISTNPFSKTT